MSYYSGMTELSPRSRRKLESIIDHSSRLFVQYGYKKVTMDSIAAEAGVSKVTLYKYFSDKQKLYEHILEINYRNEFDALLSITKRDLSFREKMENIVNLRMEKFREKSIPLYRNDFPMSPELSDFIKIHRDKMKEIRKELFQQGRDEGAIKKEISDETLTLYFLIVERGLTNSLGLLSHTDKSSLEELFSLLFTGILH